MQQSNIRKWRLRETGTRGLVSVDETNMNRPSVDQVRAVISALYNNSDPTGKEKASEWLQELQRSVSTSE